MHETDKTRVSGNRDYGLQRIQPDWTANGISLNSSDKTIWRRLIDSSEIVNIVTRLSKNSIAGFVRSYGYFGGKLELFVQRWNCQ